MQFDIQCRGFPAAAPLTDQIRRRLGFGLARHATRVTRVQVRLDDAIAPSLDTHSWCRIRVELVDAPPVVVQDLGPDPVTLIDRCSDRAARSVTIRLERAHFGQGSMASRILPAGPEGPQRVAVAGLPHRRSTPRTNAQPGS